MSNSPSPCLCIKGESHLILLIHRCLKIIATTVVLAIIWGFVVWIDPWIGQQSPWLTQGLNAVPIWTVFILIFAWSARPSPALLLTLALTAWIFYINHIKWMELSQPLMLSDGLLAGQVIDHFDLLGSYLNLSMLMWLSLALVIGTRWLWLTEPPWFKLRARLSLAALGIGALAFLASPMGLALYQNHQGPNRPWAPIHNIQTQGWLAYAVNAAHTELVALPSVDPDAVTELKGAFTPTPITQPALAERPHIVVVLSESFFEPRYLNGADLCQLLPLWCDLIDQGHLGEMTVPTFGGNTTRTEYEVLTGIPYHTLPQGIYPYTSVVLQRSASLAWWLRSLGYQTTAIHPHDRYFWQRHRALPLLGFETFIGEQEFGRHKRSGFWISDEDLTRKVIETLEHDPDTPQFVFAISMENHGPWHGKRPNMDEATRDALPTIEGLNDRAQHAYRNYLYHQRQAVDALSQLWAHAQQSRRSTVILFFGDHLPGLHDTFQQAGMMNDLTPLSHPVPYLLLTTNQVTPQTWQPNASHQLGPWLLSKTGLPMPSDYQLLIEAHGGNAEASIEAIYPYLMSLDPAKWALESCRYVASC